MQIWCLFSIENAYDQPRNNLVAWWPGKPDFEKLLDGMGGSLENEASILAAANVMQGQSARLSDADYRLELIDQGVLKAF